MNYQSKLTAALLLVACMAFVPSPLKMRKFIKNRIELLVPVDFGPMPKALADKQLAGDHQAKVILSSKKGEFALIVDEMPMRLKENELGQYLDLMEQNFRNMYKNMKVLSRGERMSNGHKVGYLEMNYDVSNGKIYDSMLFLPTSDQLMMVGFNCDQPRQAEWQPTVQKIMKSVKLLRY